VLARLTPSVSRTHAILAAIGVLSLFIAPTVWAITPVLGADAGLPFAGPELLSRPARAQTSFDNLLVDYLVANRGGAEFLVATVNANSAAPILLATGEPVMATGGFTGNDRILSSDQLSRMISNNVVRFFLLTPQGNENELSRWVTEHCANATTAVRPLLAAPRPGNLPNTGPGGAQQLYDCARRK